MYILSWEDRGSQESPGALPRAHFAPHRLREASRRAISRQFLGRVPPWKEMEEVTKANEIVLHREVYSTLVVFGVEKV